MTAIAVAHNPNNCVRSVRYHNVQTKTLTCAYEVNKNYMTKDACGNISEMLTCSRLDQFIQTCAMESMLVFGKNTVTGIQLIVLNQAKKSKVLKVINDKSAEGAEPEEAFAAGFIAYTNDLPDDTQLRIDVEISQEFVLQVRFATMEEIKAYMATEMVVPNGTQMPTTIQ